MTILLRESSLWEKNPAVARIVARRLYRTVILINTIAVKRIAKQRVNAAGKNKSTLVMLIIVRTSSVQIKAGNNGILIIGKDIVLIIQLILSVIVNNNLSVIGGVIKRSVATHRLLQHLQRATR